MAAYYEAKNIGHHIYHIYEPGNTYTSLIIGNTQAMLIDTGYGFSNLHSFVRTLTDLPLIVVNTHGHVDHAGGNFLFDRIYMHPEEVTIYRQYMSDVRPVVVRNFEKQDKENAAKNNIQNKSSVLPEDFDKAAYLNQDMCVTEPLYDGQCFDLGGRVVQAILLPGHTAQHMIFFDEHSGILFGGDDVSNNVWLQFDFSVPLHEYAQHLEALNHRLKPTGVVTSHSDVVFCGQLMTYILTAIRHIDDTESKEFIHPRTGDKALLHTERFDHENVAAVKKVHIVYNKDNK